MGPLGLYCMIPFTKIGRSEAKYEFTNLNMNDQGNYAGSTNSGQVLVKFLVHLQLLSI